MQVLQTWDDLGEVMVGLSLIFAVLSIEVHSAIHNVVEKLSVLRVLHDHEDGVRCFDDFIELSDGWMSYELQNVQFTRDSFYVSDIFYFIFLQDFDGDWLLCVIMYGLFDFAESALADGVPYYERKYCMV